MSDPCTCHLGADECDGQFGVFWPLQDGGSCAVRQCPRPTEEPLELTPAWPLKPCQHMGTEPPAAGVPASAYLAKVEADPRRAAALQRARDRAAGVEGGGDAR